MTPERRAELKVMLNQYRSDFARYARENLTIKGTGIGEELAFTLNGPQRIMHKRIDQQVHDVGYIRAVILKGRQQGCSTYSQGRSFHLSTLNRNVSTLLVALDDDSSAKIFNMIDFFYDKLPPLFKPLARFSNKKEKVFENPNKHTRSTNPGLSSRMDFASSRKIHAGVSTTRHCIHLSEMSKWRQESVAYLNTSLLPTLHMKPGTILINESTAFIEGEAFRELCIRAESGKSEYVFIFVPWWIKSDDAIPLSRGELFTPTAEERAIIKLAKHGDRNLDIPACDITPEQLKWRRARVDGFESEHPGEGEMWFAQEYPSTPTDAWVDVDARVFSDDGIQAQRANLMVPIRMIEMDGTPKRIVECGGRVDKKRSYIAIFREPVRGHHYDIGGDVAMGEDDGDWSVAEVFDRDTHEQVAEYHKHIDPHDYADELLILARYYNDAQLGVEHNAMGIIVNQRLVYHGYHNIYIWRNLERAVPTPTKMVGWKTQQDSKILMVGQARTLFVHNQLTIHSPMLLEEMSNFLHLNENRYECVRGHDDAVIALCICLIIGVHESFGQSVTPRMAGLDPKAAVQAAIDEYVKGFAADNSSDVDRRILSVAQAFKKELEGQR